MLVTGWRTRWIKLYPPEQFRVYRPKEGHAQSTKSWRNLRRGVADLHRRAQVSEAANHRYLIALASGLSVKASSLCRDYAIAIYEPNSTNPPKTLYCDAGAEQPSLASSPCCAPIACCAKFLIRTVTNSRLKVVASSSLSWLLVTLTLKSLQNLLHKNLRKKTTISPIVVQMDVPKRFAVRCSKNSSGTKMLMPETVCDWPPICGILTRSISGLRFQFRISGLIDGSWHIDPNFIHSHPSSR